MILDYPNKVEMNLDSFLIYVDNLNNNACVIPLNKCIFGFSCVFILLKLLQTAQKQNNPPPSQYSNCNPNNEKLKANCKLVFSYIRDENEMPCSLIPVLAMVGMRALTVWGRGGGSQSPVPTPPASAIKDAAADAQSGSRPPSIEPSSSAWTGIPVVSRKCNFMVKTCLHHSMAR